MSKPLVIAHRGGSKLAPENTLAAFENALALGADGFELDVHPTRDGQLVVIHDDDLDRTTDGSGPVHQQTYAELQSLDAGQWFGDKWTGQRVSRLEDVLALLGPQTRLILEIKHPDRYPRYDGIEELVVQRLRHAQRIEQSVVICFEHRTLATVRKLEPALATGLLYAFPIDLDEIEDLGVSYLGPYYKLVTPTFVERAQNQGYKLNPWTVDEPEDLHRLLTAGVDALTTDRPDLLLAILKAT